MQMKFGILVALTVLIACPIVDSFGQRKLDKAAESILPINSEWCEGSIMTSDGIELKGLLRYNEHSGLLSYENGGEGRSFTSRAVAGFEYFDERLQKQRVFYSIPYDDERGISRPLFFEVMKEFRSFAVLSKIDPIDIEYKAISSPGAFDPTTGAFAPSGNYGTRIETSQTETIYLMDAKGTVKPYLRIVETDIDGVIFDRVKTKNKLLDGDLLEHHVGKEMNNALVRYAKEKDLSFKRKSDLIKILNYYAQQIR